MASGKSASFDFENISRRHFECGICTDRYKDPKILDCLHTFCLQCLKDYITKTCNGSDSVPCPVCRSKTELPDAGARGLKTNFHMVSLLEDFALQEKLNQQDSDTEKILCEICKTEEKATHWCLECAQKLCTDCGKRHLRFAASLTHTVCTLQEIRQEKLQPSKKLTQQDLQCPNHKGEVLRFFCTTCQVLICRDCIVIDHAKPEHVYIGGNQATAKYKQCLTEFYSPLEGKLEHIQEELANISKTRLQLRASVDRITTEVQIKADKLRQEITRQEMGIIEEIGRARKERQEKLDETEKALHLLSNRIQNSLETTRDITGTTSDSHFLSLYPTISNDLKLLSGQNTPEVDSMLPYPRFKHRQGVEDINFGELVTSGRWELCREFGQKGSGPGEFNYACDIAVRRHDEIAVTDVLNNRVQIFGVDGTNKCQIALNNSPHAVALVEQSNRLVIVCDDQVRAFNQDNWLAFMFSTIAPGIGKVHNTRVSLRSAAVTKDGNLLVSDVYRKVVNEHSPTGALLRTIPVGITPSFLAARINGGLIISSRDEAVVHVTDGDGTTLFSIKPTIEGQPVTYCWGVCSDHSGLYIAVRNKPTGTGHIHYYDAQGAFLTCIAQGLYRPRGITITPAGQIAVADYHSVKIYH